MTRISSSTHGMKGPCLGCTDRHLGCHSECERYKQYQRNLEEAKQKEQQQKDYRNQYFDARYGYRRKFRYKKRGQK